MFRKTNMQGSIGTQYKLPEISTFKIITKPLLI